jgi:hypothetical protein
MVGFPSVSFDVTNRCRPLWSVPVGCADAKGEKTRFQGEERFFPSEMLLFLTVCDK